jgi:hypothetical protein
MFSAYDDANAPEKIYGFRAGKLLTAEIAQKSQGSQSAWTWRVRL